MVLSSYACGGMMGPGNTDAHSLSAQEQAIQVYQGTVQPTCAYDQLATVEATSGSAFEMGTFESTIAKLKQKAAPLGADGIIVTEHFKNQMADQATAFAIRCKTVAASPAPLATPNTSGSQSSAEGASAGSAPPSATAASTP